MDFLSTGQHILGRDISVSEGIDLSKIIKAEKELAISIPKALKDFYHYLGNVDIFVDGHQHFPSLSELFVKDNKLVFLQENQSVVYWAVDLTDGKSIFQTTHQNFDEDVEWYKEAFDLPDFLNMLLYFQILMSDNDYHKISNTGFEYFASLNTSDYENNASAQKYLNNLEPEFENVFKSSDLSIFWEKDTIIMILIEDSIDHDFVFCCTKQEHMIALFCEQYSFREF